MRKYALAEAATLEEGGDLQADPAHGESASDENLERLLERPEFVTMVIEMRDALAEETPGEP